MNKIAAFFDKFLNLKYLIIFNAIILVLKIAYSIYFNFPGLYFEDWSIAMNIANNGIYSEYINIGPTAYKLPIYPLYLSFWIKLFPDFSKEAIVISQHIIFFIIPFLIANVGRLLFNTKIGCLAGLFFIFSPGYFYYSNVIEATNLFIPLFLIWINFYLNIYLELKKNKGYFILFGVVTALLALTQVVVVPIILVGFLALLFFRKVSIKNIFLIGFVSTLCYSPWVIRNYIVFDKIIVSKTPVWQNIYFSFTSYTNVLDDVKLISDRHEYYTFHGRKHIDEFEMEKIYEFETRRVLEDKEGVFLKKMAQNVVLLWYVPSRYFYDSSLSIVIGRKFYTVALNLMTILSFVYFYRLGRKKMILGYLVVFIGFTFPYAIGHAANTRFKLDFEYLQYVLVAAYLYSIVIQRYKKTSLN